MLPQNGHLILENGNDWHFIRFGKGENDLVIIPGLGDGLITVKGKAFLGPLMFGYLSSRYRITIISRKENLAPGATTESMADDQAEAMLALGIRHAHAIGISQGGMILQHLAARHPDIIDRMVLTVTCPECNPIIEDNVERWLEIAGRNDIRGLMLDINLKSHTSDMEARIRRQSRLYSLLGRPESWERFRIQADACLTHDAQDALHLITSPTLIIGGEKDVTLGADASRELHEKIKGSMLYMYEDYGHALYEDAPDFMARVHSFLSD